MVDVVDRGVHNSVVSNSMMGSVMDHGDGTGTTVTDWIFPAVSVCFCLKTAIVLFKPWMSPSKLASLSSAGLNLSTID